MENIQENDVILKDLLNMGTTYFIKDYRHTAKIYPRAKLEQVFSILEEYDLRSKGVGSRKFSSKELLKEMVFKILH